MIRKNKNIVFTIADPDVFKSPAADTFVIFGEAKIEDMQSMMQQEAARQMALAKVQPPTASPRPRTEPPTPLMHL